MASPREFAALFARTLDLFRDPGAKEEQKAQFRTLTGLLKVQGVTLSVQDGRLAVNGTTLDGNTLAQRLEFHAVKEINIPADPPVAEVFELLRALADQPGDEDLASRFTDIDTLPQVANADIGPKRNSDVLKGDPHLSCV